MSYDFKKIKDHKTTLPRDEAWDNWQSWKDAKVGDGVEGIIADAFFRPEEVNPDGSIAFRSQRGITITQEDGVLINVGVKDLDFVLKATDNLRVGDPIRIEFTEQKAPAQKGQAGAKIFQYFGENIEASEGNKTIKVLTDEDRATGGTVEPEEEAPTAEDVKDVGVEVTDEVKNSGF